MQNKEKEFRLRRIEAFIKRIKKNILEETVYLNAKFAKTSDLLSFNEAKKLNYKEIKEGEKWGDEWECAWFILEGEVPKSWKGKEVVAQIELTGEGLIFDDNGVPAGSITNGSVFDSHFNKDLFYLFKKCGGGEKVRIVVEAVANHLFGINQDPDPAEDSPKRYGSFEAKVNKIRLASFNRKLYNLWLDMEVLLSLAKKCHEDSVRRARIISTANDAMDAYADNPENVDAALEILKEELEKKASASDLSTVAVGHAHIDTGWLWPVRESIRKSARTFASQLSLIEKYPGYVFGASQAQHYAFIKEYYPELYEKIKAAVKDGSWEIQGAMWVEADCNIAGGESLVRQIIHGKNFFMDEFGFDVKNLWLPDVFGYAAAIPQILLKSGVEFFVTQKLSWSQFNKFPHTTFIWRGIDGSEVITHFPPEATYNSSLMPADLMRARDSFCENHFLDEFLTLFGIGDGGGGPKEEYIERGLRQQNLESVPKVRFGRADKFLERLRKYKDKLNIWSGELYLECHRGTYTTQAKVKKGNRKLEQKLRMTEFIASCLPLDKYPSKELDKIWKTLLINQFHDILPGSSINLVYKDTWRQHEECLKKCAEIINDAAKNILHKDNNSITLANCLSTHFSGTIELTATENGLSDEFGNEIPAQIEGNKLVAKINIPGCSFTTLQKSGKPQKAKINKSLTLENELIKYEFDKDGTIRRIYDKECSREVLENGKKGNLFTLYKDRPLEYDAWDIDLTYEKAVIAHPHKIEVKPLFLGPVRTGIAFSMSIGKSTIEQEIYLQQDSKMLEFNTKIDWREKHKMLRVSFPININTDAATCEIQYGHVKRPTHRNTSWDLAKFEVCAHRYVDISEFDYGVALINDCKYGHKIFDNILDLNILRSPTYPDPDADIGIHEFKYCLLPHRGNFADSDVIIQAAAINLPPEIFDGYSAKGLTPPCRLLSMDNSVSLEVVKKAEKEDCIVIRVVETKGSNSSATLLFRDKNAKIAETDIMEWKNIGKIIRADSGMDIHMKPFEIKTFKVWTA